MFGRPTNASANTLIGTVAASKGGTGATTPAGARANLQITGPAVGGSGSGSVRLDPAGRRLIAPGLWGGLGTPSTYPNADGLNHNGFPQPVMTATGRIACLYRHAIGHNDPNNGPGSQLLIRFSDDLGDKWSSPSLVYTDAVGDVTNSPIFRVNSGPNAGRIFVLPVIETATTRGRTLSTYSDDHGQTWSTPVSIYDAARWGTDGRQHFPSPPVELADGTLLIACYGWGTPQPTPLTYIASVYKSTDHGQTWTWLSTLDDGAALNRQPEEPNLALLDDGSILASIRYDNDLTIRFRKSTDGGATWSAEIAVINGCGLPVIRQMTNAAPGTPGAIVCVTRGDQPTFPGQQTIYYTSRDRGVTWIGPVAMDERTLPDYIYSGLWEVSPGVMLCTYGVEYPSTGAYAESNAIYLLDGNNRSPLGGATHAAVSTQILSLPSAAAPTILVTPAITSGATVSQLEAQLNAVIKLLGQGPLAAPHPLSLASCFGLWEAENIPNTVNDWSGTMATVSDLTRLDGGTLAGTALAGTWGISGSTLKLSASLAKSAFTWDPGKADLTFKVKFTYASGASGVVFRAVDGSNLLTVKIASSFTKLYKRIAGTETQLAAGATIVTGAGDYWCQVTLAGASISVWVWADGNSQPANPTISYTLTGSDLTTFQSPTKHGVGADDTSQAYANVSFTLGLAEGDAVGYLPDTSGLVTVPNGSPLNLTQATVSKQPTLVHLTGYFRAKPVLLLNGSGVNLLSTAFTARAQPNAIVGVFYLPASTVQFHLLAGQGPDGSGNSQNISIQSNSILQISAGTGLSPAAAVAFPYGPHVFTAIFNGATSSLRIDGQAIVSGNANTKSWTQVSLGDSVNTSKMYTPGFAGLHGTTAAADAQAAERYFAAKYGINLAS